MRVQLPLSGLCLGFCRSPNGLHALASPRPFRRVFRILLINERTPKNPDFPPLARTPINSPFEGLFVARERELEKGSSLTLLPHLLGYSPSCVSLSADLGVLTGARCSASLTRRCMRSCF